MKWWNKEDFTESAMHLKFNNFLNSLWQERKLSCILSKMSPRSKIREVSLKHLTFPLKNKECLNCMLCLKVSIPSQCPPSSQLCIILFSLLGFTTVWPRVVFFLNDNESNWKYWLAVQLSCQHNHLICQEDLLNCQKSYKKTPSVTDDIH